MKKFIYITLLSVFIISCTSNTIFKKPKNLIPKEEMVALLVDMQLALGAKTIKNIDKKRNINYMHLVYEKHAIDSARFAESNFYYTTNIDDYNEILKEVKKRITTLKEKYDAEKTLKDSLEKPKKIDASKLKKIPASKRKKLQEVLDTTLVK